MGRARDLARLLPNSSGQLPTANIQDDAINAAKIAANAVSSSEIASASVTPDKTTTQVFAVRGDCPSGNNENLNNYMTAGVYNYVMGSYSGTTNIPPSGAYGTMVVFNSGSFTTQMVFMHAGGVGAFGYYRTKYNAGTNNDYWMSWSAF
jgi:hypothetical protein